VWVRIAATLASAAAAAAIGGCGLEAGPGDSAVVVSVTRDFGARSVVSARYRPLSGPQTVGGLLRRSAPSLTWSGAVVYVNGLAVQGPGVAHVHPGDRIWLDLHHPSAAPAAVVGSFPEPFVHGIAGKRLPVTLECSPDVGAACRQVTVALEAIGVAVAVQEPGTGSGTDSLSVVVGTWADLHGEIAAELVAHGPADSGVYARFSASGRRLELLDPRGEVAGTSVGGAGLIAAVAQGSSAPTWLITGTDPAGVRSAAGALDAARLRNHFAVAVTSGVERPVPVLTR
jgi:hypothetical protein